MVIDNKLNTLLAGEIEKIYIWDFNFWSKTLVTAARNKLIEPQYIIADSDNKEVEWAWGIPVLHRSDANTIPTDAYLFIDRHSYAMNKKIISEIYGFTRNRIWIESVEPTEVPLWKNIYYELSSARQLRHIFKSIELKKIDVERSIMYWKGLKVFRKLRHKIGNDTKILFFNYTGTGDVFLCCLLLRQYLSEKRISDYRIVTYNKACKKVTELFGYRDVIALSGDEGHYFRSLVLFAGETNLNTKLMIKYPNPRDISIKFACSEMTLLDNFRYTILGLGKQADLSTPEFNMCFDKISKVFDDMHLTQGKTAIISPYCNSEVTGSTDFWKEVVALLTDIGYQVVTMASPSEQPIPGTKKIFFEYADTYTYLEYAGLFVGSRSGFCDIAIGANVKKVIFYFENEKIKGYYSLAHMNKKKIYDFASFEKMGIAGDYLEVKCVYKLTKKKKEKIIDYIGGRNV